MSENEQWHMLVNDEDGHWYVIPAAENDEFECWLSAAPYWEDYCGKDFSDCRIAGHPSNVKFRHYYID